MSEKTFKLWVNPQRSADNPDDDFDKALAAACGELRHQRLAALEPAPRRSARPRRIAWVAAVAALLCAVGAYAVWPELVYTIKDGIVYQTVTDAPPAQEIQQMQFGYLPEGYTLTWAETEGSVPTEAIITYNEKAHSIYGSGKPGVIKRRLIIWQFPLREEMGYYTGADGAPLTEAEWAEIQSNYHTVASPQELTAKDVDGTKIVRWQTSRYLYQCCLTADFNALKTMQSDELPDARSADIIGILQGITP